MSTSKSPRGTSQDRGEPTRTRSRRVASVSPQVVQTTSGNSGTLLYPTISKWDTLQTSPSQKRPYTVFPSSPTSPLFAGDFSPFRLDDLELSNSPSKFFTITLIDSTRSDDQPSFSFTASPPSPPPDSIMYPLPPRRRERPVSVQTMPLPSRQRSDDISERSCTSVHVGSIIVSENLAAMSQDIGDWMQPDTHFTQDYPPFPETPDCWLYLYLFIVCSFLKYVRLGSLIGFLLIIYCVRRT